MEKLLHTPEGVRDIYNVECGKKLALENRLKKHCIYLDIMIFRLRPLNILMCSGRKSEQYRPKICTNFLIKKATRWFCDQISHRPSHVWLLHYLERKISRYGFVTQVIHLLTIPTIRDD